MDKIIKRIIQGIGCLVLVITLYTIWDNHRFVVVEQEIIIDLLPEELDEFRILQVSDLHEKQFGKNQKRLVTAINSIDYDAIVFTGDMLDESESTNYDRFYSLIEGIDNKDNAFYVAGNTDPANYHVEQKVEKSPFISGMEARGVELLESIQGLTAGEGTVYLVNFELSVLKTPQYATNVQGILQPEYVNDENYQLYQAARWQELSVLDQRKEADVMVALNHYPIPDIRVDHIQANPHLTWRDYDLIMAGHYHGGQIRVPLVGALFVPEPWYEPNGIFPPQDRVKGLWEYKGTKQYVSTGLGSSGALSFSKFRLFNPPEINLVRLKTAANIE
ncbi:MULTISPECIES: metallophosphoesterase [Gracilibacillus]|uniref:metallophosphoesterase n=1 Tax=Gracilibacillus TaxID=74385 RepID=UPI0008248D49|nr:MULTISPECIES: metallophosphoesterase [Gracilibacillus]